MILVGDQAQRVLNVKNIAIFWSLGLLWKIPNCSERITWDNLLPISTTEDTSLAAPTPPPIAIPTSAEASAAASLMPSPTMATNL